MYKRRTLILYLGVVVALLPILIWRDFTPSNELRYLSIADEALHNHTFFTFYNHGVAYTDKPPLYLWAVMLFRWITGNHYMWLLSLLSLLPALGIIKTMDNWVAKELNPNQRILAQLMLLTCGLFVGSAITLRMDMLMCFFIVLALHEFWKIQSGTYRIQNTLLFPLYIFLAVFTKGPLGLLMPLVATSSYLIINKKFKDILTCWGWHTWAILIGCCALWFVAVYVEAGGDYLYDLLFRQTAGRAVKSFHHAQPVYYYAISIWYSLAPWALLAMIAFALSLRKNMLHSELQKFFITTAMTIIIMLSCISSKLGIYLLPAIPFLIYAVVMALPKFNHTGWQKICLIVPAMVYVLAAPALMVVCKTMPEETLFLKVAPFYMSALILSFTGTISFLMLCKEQKPYIFARIIWIMSIGLLLAVFVGGWGMPELNKYIGYKSLCQEALNLSREHNISKIQTWHVSRSENIDVYLHRPIQVICNDSNVEHINHNEPYVLLTRKKYLKYFPHCETQTVGPYAVVVKSPAITLRARNN